jgi:predicted O-methyltransferase YrrM
LWSGRVLQAPAPDADTAAIQAFNDFVKASPDLQSTLLPVRDGLHLIRRINPS